MNYQSSGRTRLRTACITGLLLLVLPAVGLAQFTHTTNSGAITITGYTGPGGTVVIPGTISGLPVTRIGDNAFEQIASLTSVTIPNGVTNIGGAAFLRCYNLTTVTIPDGVISIGDAAFEYCTSLTDVTLPASVTVIGIYAFADCNSLTAITVDVLNPAYVSVDGVLFDQSQTTIIQYPGGKAGSYTIPVSVTVIPSGAFSSCTNLTDITIPASVTILGNYAFYKCSALTSATIPDSISFIGNYAFQFCTGLTNATIPTGVTGIGASAFEFCYNLISAPIPDTVTSIGAYAFSQSGVINIAIPASVTSLDNYAFYRCYATAVTVDALNPNYASVGGVLFNKSLTRIILVPAGRTGSYTIPASVTTIGISAFDFCTQLRSVTIPASVTHIESYAFANDYNLTAAYFFGNAPTFAIGAVGGSAATVYYAPGTTNWGATYDSRPTVLWNPAIQTGALNFGVKTNKFGFTVTGNTNLIVVVEASTTLTNANWTRLSTNALLSGPFYFSDAGWTNYPVRFYRMRAP